MTFMRDRKSITLFESEDIFNTVTMRRVITAFLKEIETIKYFSYFSNNFS